MGQRLALLVGNSQFQHPALNKLDGPDEDVIALRDVLRNPAICGFDDVQFVNNNGLQSTMTAVAQFFQAAEPDDTLLFYYSGHGLIDLDGNIYFATRESDPALLAGSAIEGRWLHERMERCRAARQVLILDCCHSGAFMKGARKQTGSPSVTRTTFDTANQGTGRFVLTSSSHTELSFEDGVEVEGEMRTHGVFTHALWTGLSEGIAGWKQPEITVEALYDHAHAATRARDSRMTPHLWTLGRAGVVVLAPNSAFAPPLDPELLAALNDENSRTIRRGAVRELQDVIARDDPPGIAETARAALEQRAADEDSRSVYALIQEALGIADSVPESLTSLQAENQDLARKLRLAEEAAGESAAESKRVQDRLAQTQAQAASTASAEKDKIAKLERQLANQPKPKALRWSTVIPIGLVVVGIAAASGHRIGEQGARALAPGQIAVAETDYRDLQSRSANAERQVKLLNDQVAELRPQLKDASSALKARDARISELETALANAGKSGSSPDQTKAFPECAECPEMVVIPSGSFTMGSPKDEPGRDNDEGPQREVTVPKFAMGKYEVTFAEWDACVADGGCGGYKPDDEGWGRNDRPVINISWNDAQQYIDWLNGKVDGEPYRLPSEAEWEYAARAGELTAYPWGADWDAAKANGARSVGRTSEVGKYPANDFKLHDMIGNVSEWVQDDYHDSYEGAPTDGSAWLGRGDGRKVLRGGSWFSLPQVLRSAYRIRNYPVGRFFNIGFRVSRTLTP